MWPPPAGCPHTRAAEVALPCWLCPAMLDLSPTQEHVRPPPPLTPSHPGLFLSPVLKVNAFPGMWQLPPFFPLSDPGPMPRGKRLS